MHGDTLPEVLGQYCPPREQSAASKRASEREYQIQDLLGY